MSLRALATRKVRPTRGPTSSALPLQGLSLRRRLAGCAGRRHLWSFPAGESRSVRQPRALSVIMEKPLPAPQWDAFISYASEDRAGVAQPLAEALASLGLRVWFDQTELRVGDSLRERIDDGLARSMYGIVILSPAFFEKHYPARELNGLAQREVQGEKVILPVWYHIDEPALRRFSPPLADRIAARWDEGIDTVVAKLFAVVGKQAIEDARKAADRLTTLVEVHSGSVLVQLLDGVHAHRAINDELETHEEVEIVSSFLDGLGDTIDGLSFVDGAGERARVGFSYTEELKTMNRAGWRVFAARVREPMPGVEGDWDVALIAVVRDLCTHVAYVDGQFFVAKGKGRDAGV